MNSWSNFRILRNSFTCHWIRIASIVLCLDLQSLPKHVSEAEMSCGVFWSLAELLKAKKTLKRHFPISNNFVNDLLRRNWYQVKDSNGVFPIGKLSASRSAVEGGTGWAVQMSVDSKKPVYVFDIVKSLWQQFEDRKRKFVYCEAPRLTLNFTGIGTRALPENGKVAIEKIFEETFGSLSRFRS